MKNDGCTRETVYFVKSLSQHIDPVVPSPHKLPHWMILQKLQMFYKKLKVMMRYKKLNHAARVLIAEKQIKRMILVLNVSCLHIFFLMCKIIFLGFIFIMNTGGNQHSFCDMQTKNFDSYMTENFFKICRKCNDKFF